MADDMFKKEIKSFMGDIQMTQEKWDAIFRNKEESDHDVKQGETFERWWEENVLGPVILEHHKPLKAQTPLQND